ncbi:restriction endonuclease subunit S [Actinobacillus equuli subsp. haemolyticus]|nr:restriction endonuclease subunit S [Actinobacillus equuli]WGE86315.1 restriction endonuclease subunit S [Actinobacillus equuli subsp. haemolyticus]
MADIRRGASPRPIQDPKWFDNKKSNIGWLRISDVTEQNGRILFLEQKLSELGQEKTLVLNSPHLILSIAATVGKPVINYVPTGIHDGFIVFLNLKADMEFLFQWLEIFRLQWQKLGQSGSQVNINSELVRNQTIILPKTLEEQTAIGNFFKQLDDTIASHQCELTKFQILKNTYLDVFFCTKNTHKNQKNPNVWEQRKLGEVVEIIGGGTPDTNNPEYWNGNIDWYSPTEIGKQIYVNNSVKKISVLGLQKSSAKILPAHKTILFTSRAGIGDMAILAKEGATNQGFQSLVLQNESVDIYFLYSLGYKIKEFALKNASGSTFLEISKNTLAQTPILLPCLEEQTAIGNFFKQLDDTIASHQRIIAKYRQIKAACLAKMFV